MRQFIIFIICLTLTGTASAQTTITITAEATETIRVKPTSAKIILNVESKAGESAAAVEANTDSRKALVRAIEKLNYKTVTSSVLQQKISKDRDNSNRRFGGGGPGGAVPQGPQESYSVLQPVAYTVTETDPVKLIETVEKITLTAANLGITGDKNIVDSFGGFSPYNDTRNTAKVTYASSDTSWEEATGPALKKATARAIEQAKAMAEGAKLKVIDIVAVEEVPENAGQDSPYIYRGPINEEGYSEVELTRKVRIRVKVTASK